MSDQSEPKYGKCPHCGYIPEVLELFYAEGDLIQCKKCNGRIDVVKNEKGELVFVVSTDMTYGL